MWLYPGCAVFDHGGGLDGYLCCVFIGQHVADGAELAVGARLSASVVARGIKGLLLRSVTTVRV